MTAEQSPPVATEEPDTAEEARTSRTRIPGRWTQLELGRLAALLAPAAVFLAVRAIGLMVLAVMVEGNGARLGSELSSWDGEWLLGIAGGGYDGVPLGLVDAFGQRSAETPFAFFPGYPAAVAVTAFLSGFDLLWAGLLVSSISGVVAAYGLTRLGGLVPGGSRRVGLLLVALFAAAPMSVVLTMTYSEALFCALAVWALVGVEERRWLLAGLTCAAAGLIRPTGAALILAVGLAALVALIQRRDGLRPLLAGLLAPAGFVGYLGYVGWQTGSLAGWFGVQQRGWDSRFDGGAATVKFTIEVLDSGRSVLEVLTVLVLVGGVVLLVTGYAQRLPWPLLAYGAAVLAMDLGSNGLMNSKARLLLPAFVLLLPVAIGLARRRPTTALATVAGVVLASAWFGAYALVAWPYAI